jgi:pentatricopeptide repeat protein
MHRLIVLQRLHTLIVPWQHHLRFQMRNSLNSNRTLYSNFQRNKEYVDLRTRTHISQPDYFSNKFIQLYFKNYCTGPEQSEFEEPKAVTPPKSRHRPGMNTRKPLDQFQSQKGKMSDEEVLQLLNDSYPALNLNDLPPDVADDGSQMEQVLSSDKKRRDWIYSKFFYQYRLGNHDQVFKIFDQMKAHNVPLDVGVYNALMYTLEATHQTERILSVFNDMKNSGVRPNALTYNLVIKAQVDAGDTTLALKFYEEMRSAKVIPIPRTYVNLLRAARVVCSSDLAIQIYKDMKASLGPRLPREALLLYIQVLCEDHRPVDAIQALKSAMERETFFLPAFIVNLLLKTVIEDDYIEGCEFMFQYLQKFVEMRRTQWDEGTLSRFLEAAARNGRFIFAEQLINALSQPNIGLTQAHFSALLLCYANGGFYSKAFDAIMKYVPPFVVHPAVREAIALVCSRSPEEIDRAYLSLEDIYVQAKRPVPLECFNIIITACAHIGDFDRALLTMQELPKFSLSPDVETFNSLLMACLVAGQTDPIKAIIAEAKKANVVLNAKSYEYIIRTYLQRDLTVDAISYLEEMMQQGIVPTYYTFHCIVFTLKHTEPNTALETANKATKYYNSQSLFHIINASGRSAYRAQKIEDTSEEGEEEEHRSPFSSLPRSQSLLQSQDESKHQEPQSPILRVLKTINTSSPSGQRKDKHETMLKTPLSSTFPKRE